MDDLEAYQTTVTLKDGSTVLLRPIRPSDAPLLQEAFKRLSTESIRMRFLETAKELSDKQAQALATVDYTQRMAMVGTMIEDGQERVVVSARYAVIEGEEAGLAEAAIVVTDDYQTRGLGKFAMQHLVRYAREHGVVAFIATIHISNSRVMKFINGSGLKYSRSVLEPGTWEIRIDLQQQSL